ncbi:MAG: amino acid ABC transporter permease [Holosporales bacterium]|jgi:polar amino acid transport system permease protein|nr:amino acid ABC transporter permease [Holosporales bacterium]
MSKFISNFLYIASGATLTLKILAGSILIGLSLGVLFSILRRHKICKAVVCGVVSVIRGTPTMLQISIVYFTLPSLFGFNLGILATGIIALGINSAAYVSEILRAGIESLPKGQFEAAYTLGVPSFYMWKDIILPQVVMNIFPALINETVTLLKETALIATIGGMDIMRKSQVIAAEKYEYFTPLCTAAFVYYVLVLLIEFMGKKVERKRLYAKNL